MRILKFLSAPVFWLVVILVVSFLVRLYKIDNPVADWHSWRQADTAAVARNFYKRGLPSPIGERKEDFTFSYFINMIITPKYDDMSVVSEVGRVNPERYRFVEFPIYPSLVYFGYLINGGVDERIARIVSILFSLGSVVFIYLLSKKYFDVLTGLTAALVFSILPFAVFYSRVILPEPSLVFFSLGALYFVDRWIWEKGYGTFFVGLLFTICALLTKPFAVFYLVPLVYSYLAKEKSIFKVNWRYIVFVLLAALPFIGWRMWISQHPEGIPASTWLFNGNGIRLRPAFWRWIVGDRLGREILSIAGGALFMIGLIVKPRIKEGWLLYVLAASMGLYLVVVATGNVQHDYYQYLITPVLVIFIARGFVLLIRGFSEFIPRIWTIPMGGLLLVLCLYLTWVEVKGLYQINNWSIVEAGRMADKILPAEAKIVAPYGGDTAFLYQTNRSGFPILAESVESLKQKYGVGYYISTSKNNETVEIMKNHKVLIETPRYVIVEIINR